MLEELPPVPLPGDWDGALLAPIAEINQRLLESLRDMANGATVATVATGVTGAGRQPRLVTQLEQEWRRLDPLSLQRLSHCPYLLVDAAFGEPARWEQLLASAVGEAAVPGGYFAGPQGVSLVRATLLLAWHLARSNRLSARMLLGMDGRSAERIGASRLQDLEALAEQGASWIVPRWERAPLVWQQLLRAARGEAASPLRAVQLRGLQLIAATCSRPRA